MAETQLRAQIRSLRYPPGPRTERSFIPQRLLYNLLTKDAVSVAIQQTSMIPGYHVSEVVDVIMKGGRKVFAILVVLKREEARIVDFIKHDQFGHSRLDYKLPFSMQTLTDIAPEIADEFYDAQWEFIAPVFSQGILHRELHERTKLPFIQDEPIGEGGFGDVYKIELHPDHQTLPFMRREGSLQAVRKEFKRSSENEIDYKLELKNLNLLNELKHPNIVELLGSYTYQGRHNLIFRLAVQGNLATLLQSDRPVTLASDNALFVALSQLSSAIATVHEFMSKSLNLKYIGCHHDLKPKNILVHGNKFILADFGLSKFKEATESSKDLFETGQGHYLAPECEDYDSNFEKHTISRPSDIWSFGCIIAELLTYMKRGNQGVSDFKNARKIKLGQLTTYTFHAGRFNPNPTVDPWLSELESQGTPGDRMCVQLARKMLAIDPKERPTASEVTSRLRFITAVSHISSLKELFSTLLDATDSLEANMEGRRFKNWATVFESIASVSHSWNVTADQQMGFNSIIGCLIECDHEIRSIISRHMTALTPLYSKLRALVDELENFLPVEHKEEARTSLELDLIQGENVDILANRCDQYRSTSLGERICTLLTVKRMTILSFQRSKRSRPDLYIKDPGAIKPEKMTLGDHSIAMYQERRVVVEWIRYSTHWEGPVSEEMMARIEAIAELLNCQDKPSQRLVLHCSGFFHQPNRNAFGVVYDFPGITSQHHNLTPRTLMEIIRTTMDARTRPSLGDRFTLAHKLASSMLDFHKVGWVHKSISPYNVAFFHREESIPSEWIREPHIVGFNRSRPDQPKAFTEGPSMNTHSEKYQHPLYIEPQRFLPEFDYYSLGLVLLEIGLWRALDDITSGWTYSSRQKLLELLLLKRVPMLVHSMGTGYHHAVKTCLSVTLDSCSSTDNSLNATFPSHLELGHEVLAALYKCPHETGGLFETACTKLPSPLRIDKQMVATEPWWKEYQT